METEHGRPTEIITKENLQEVLTQIGQEREKWGAAETVIPRIRMVREEAAKLGDKSAVLQLYQEEFLSGQHMLMEERAKKFKANPLRVAKGIFLMETTSRTMERYQQSNEADLDPMVSARVNRFLGKYTDLKGNFGKSEEHYRTGLIHFETEQAPEKRFPRLEFSGFLSYAILKQGRTQEGVALATATLTDFDQSEEGIWLKENNYYAWAVWKSGIEIRTAEYLLKKKKNEYGETARAYLVDAEAILKTPEGDDETFRIRIAELEHAKSM
jgi:hypothetical protein